MICKEFKILINAPRAIVWNVLWGDETYPKWTAAFCEGSIVETTWEEGSQVKFLGPNGSGIISRIKKKDPQHLMFFEHIGVVEDGVAHTESTEAQTWQGATENYTLSQVDTAASSEYEKTKLHIETDITEEYLERFEKSWPKALQKVKELSERQ